MISVNDAQSIIQKNIFELKSESVYLSSSSGKILSNLSSILSVAFVLR